MISEVEYDETKKLLTLIFVKNNAKYEYQEVPKEIYTDMLAADSIGKYFLANIKDKYTTERV